MRVFDIITSDGKRVIIPSDRLARVVESGDIKLFFDGAGDIEVTVKIDDSERDGFMDWLKEQLGLAADSKLSINLSKTSTAGIQEIEL
jgi:hypothetical protein